MQWVRRGGYAHGVLEGMSMCSAGKEKGEVPCQHLAPGELQYHLLVWDINIQRKTTLLELSGPLKRVFGSKSPVYYYYIDCCTQEPKPILTLTLQIKITCNEA